MAIHQTAQCAIGVYESIRGKDQWNSNGAQPPDSSSLGVQF